jgi:hypothetical protein
MSFRATPELKNRIEQEAAENGRSISQEIEMRLAQSFRDAGALDQALDMAFGPQLAGLLVLTGRAMRQISQYAEARDLLANRPHDFATSITAARQVLINVAHALEDFASTNEVDNSWNEDAARTIVHGLFDMVKHPDPLEGSPNRRWGLTQRERLGESLAARIRREPRENNQ